MAIFGFNKAKVLAAAEKYVQQGKLQNAISEYEKVTKEDPKDLTVLNTIGDLYSRVGNADQAAKYFQKVGEHYATDGFTVKAIAMYKKLTKLNPGGVECIQRLAELYTIQGLYNDARQQYVAVADYWLKNGQNEDAAKSFQKILELDPDNTAMQSKLADLYMKLGKKNEARNIYLTAAQSLYVKQAMEAADDACARVLSIDPKCIDALMLRGTIAAESGDGKSALSYLKDIPDTDSRPEALRALLRAYLQLKTFDEAKPIVQKLLNVHNDLSGVSWYADALINAGQFAEALQIYEDHADKVLAASGPALVKTLSATINKVKESSRALQSLKVLFQKSGDTSHDAEITELLAHAYVQEGQLAQAKELYKTLSENEPENPLHAQNFKQVVAMMGDDVTTQPLTAEQASQALMIEEVDHQKAPAIPYNYEPDVAAAVRAAITDSELFESYNLPAKAIPPLEAGLAIAPRDHQLLMRLVNLYGRAQRPGDAARCAEVLKEVFTQHGHKDEAAKYAALATQYLQSASAAPTTEPTVAFVPLTAPVAQPPSVPAAAEFAMEVPAPAPEPVAASSDLAAAAAAAAASMSEPVVQEISVGSDDWESMLSVEEASAAPVETPATADFAIEVAPPVAAAAPAEQSAAGFSMEVVAAEPEAASVSEFSFDAPPAVAPVIEEPPPPPPPPVVKPAPAPLPKVKPEPPAPVAKPAPPPPAPKPAPALAPVAAKKLVVEDDILGDLVGDLEEALGEDFAIAEPPKAASPAKHVSPSPPAAPPKAAPAVAASAAAPAKAAAPPLPGIPQIAPQDAAAALSDLFEEFKEDAEATAGQAEDPDTHYNLGIAFKEMGLLDEAIGELQKVCNAVEKGHPFSQSIQAYTWLAQCLLDKGVPQAAIRWYEKALHVANISEDSKLAVYYDLGCAHELAGNQRKAYETFMEVYGSNIDYRDVADRIKTLKA